MNNFDRFFFKKYIPEGQELMHIIHIHPIVILKDLIVKIILLIVFPVLFFYLSKTIHSTIPFYYFEVYIFLLFGKIVYDIFNRYNDVWIITNSAIIALDWSFLKAKTESVNFGNIEGVGIDESGFLDKLLKKGGLVIHKVGNEEFYLEETISPYKAINIIEELRSLQKVPENTLTEERFNLLLKAITGEEKKLDENILRREKIKKAVLEDAEKSEGTIDLR